VDSAPKASVCISGGTQEIFIAVLEDLLGGTGKAEDAKSAGRRNYPEAVPNGEGGNGRTVSIQVHHPSSSKKIQRQQRDLNELFADSEGARVRKDCCLLAGNPIKD
jgi:hypothetical protein